MTTYDLQFFHPRNGKWLSYCHTYRRIGTARSVLRMNKRESPGFKYRIIKTLTTVVR